MVALCAIVFAMGGYPRLAAGDVTVGNCNGGRYFSTIQKAVNAAPPGSTVRICPATYPEQVVVAKPLTLRGLQAGNSSGAVIVPPANLAAVKRLLTTDCVIYQILVTSAQNVNLQNLTVDWQSQNLPGSAPGTTGCSPPDDVMGILYQNASGVVSDVVTRNQQLPGAAGNQAGEGIFVESSGGKSQITVQNSAVHDFQKNGITTNGAGISAQIQNNSVRGSGPNLYIAQNGIQLGYGAMGEVEGNALSDFVYSGEGYGASGSGILIVGSHGADIEENIVGNTQGGIATTSIPGNDADDTSINDNWIFGTVSTNDGIYACSNRNQVQGNTLHNSTQSGVNLDSSCGGGNNNTVKGNTINEACAGVLEVTGETGNSISNNTYFNVSNTVLVSRLDSCLAPAASPMIQTPAAANSSGYLVEAPRFQPKP
jgi:hypothetical protein